MARSDIVLRLPAGADRFPLRVLIGIALVCTSAGAALSHAVLRATQPTAPSSARTPAARPTLDAPAPHASHDASTPEQLPRTTPAEAKTPEGKAPAVHETPAPVAASPHAIAAIAAGPSPGDRDDPAAPAPPQPHARRSFQQGAVAYLRCEGAERPGARFPCPRDRKLETEVWRVLSALGECAAADPGRGHGEARLSWGRGEPLVVEWRKQEIIAGLDLAAVSKCAGDGMRGLRSSLPVQHAIAAFRFELR